MKERKFDLKTKKFMKRETDGEDRNRLMAYFVCVLLLLFRACLCIRSPRCCCYRQWRTTPDDHSSLTGCETVRNGRRLQNKRKVQSTFFGLGKPNLYEIWPTMERMKTTNWLYPKWRRINDVDIIASVCFGVCLCGGDGGGRNNKLVWRFFVPKWIRLQGSAVRDERE
jgi:hypothetical protein